MFHRNIDWFPRTSRLHIQKLSDFMSRMFFFSFTGEATDDQPFVPNNEKPTEYDPNLYLYSVCIFRWIEYVHIENRHRYHYHQPKIMCQTNATIRSFFHSAIIVSFFFTRQFLCVQIRECKKSKQS